MLKSLKKKLCQTLGSKPKSKVYPSDDKNQQTAGGLNKNTPLLTLESFWQSKPNNFQGPIVYETTFIQGGFTTFVTLPTGHCFANPKRCRLAGNSRELAAQVALTHCMFGDEIFPFSTRGDAKANDLDRTIDSILQERSQCNMKTDSEDSFLTMSYILAGRGRSKGSDDFLLLLKLELLHWSGAFHRLAKMNYTKQQIAKELVKLTVDEVCSFVLLDWQMREHKQPGAISLELCRCQNQLKRATQSQRNVRLSKEKCLVLLSTRELIHQHY